MMDSTFGQNQSLSSWMTFRDMLAVEELFDNDENENVKDNLMIEGIDLNEVCTDNDMVVIREKMSHLKSDLYNIFGKNQFDDQEFEDICNFLLQKVGSHIKIKEKKKKLDDDDEEAEQQQQQQDEQEFETPGARARARARTPRQGQVSDCDEEGDTTRIENENEKRFSKNRKGKPILNDEIEFDKNDNDNNNNDVETQMGECIMGHFNDDLITNDGNNCNDTCEDDNDESCDTVDNFITSMGKASKMKNSRLNNGNNNGNGNGLAISTKGIWDDDDGDDDNGNDWDNVKNNLNAKIVFKKNDNTNVSINGESCLTDNLFINSTMMTQNACIYDDTETDGVIGNTNGIDTTDDGDDEEDDDDDDDDDVDGNATNGTQGDDNSNNKNPGACCVLGMTDFDDENDNSHNNDYVFQLKENLKNEKSEKNERNENNNNKTENESSFIKAMDKLVIGTNDGSSENSSDMASANSANSATSEKAIKNESEKKNENENDDMIITALCTLMGWCQNEKESVRFSK